MTAPDPIALARAVVARGHEGTEAHALAVALLELANYTVALEAKLSHERPVPHRERDEFDALGFEP